MSEEETRAVHFERIETCIVDYCVSLTDKEIDSLAEMTPEQVDAFLMEQESEVDTEELISTKPVHIVYTRYPVHVLWEGE